MINRNFLFWLSNYKLASLIVGVVFLLTPIPAFAQLKPPVPKPKNETTKPTRERAVFKPRDRKPTSEKSLAGGSRRPAFAQLKPPMPKPKNETTKPTRERAVFKPRDRKPSSENSRGGGSRGCPSSNGIPITQLAPQTFIGKTASTRPMLVWYMSSEQTVELQLFELESGATPKEIGSAKKIKAIKDINKLKLPLDYPELTVGKTYLWQIAINCENDVIINRAELTVINPQSLPKKQYTSITSILNYYTENELWYEALEEALKVASHGKLSPTASALIQDLAQSEILIGDSAYIQETKQRVEYLQIISGSDYISEKNLNVKSQF